MLTLYSSILFIHVFAALIWLGGGIVMEFLHIRMGPNASNKELKEFFALSTWISPRLFVPAALTTLITGILVVAVGEPRFSDFAVSYALGAVLVAIGLGALGIGPTVKKLETLIDDPSADPAMIHGLKRRLRLVTNFDLAILISILFDVVTDPKWDSYVTMSIIGLFLLAVVIYNLFYVPKVKQ
jgi:hypothetical protein